MTGAGPGTVAGAGPVGVTDAGPGTEAGGVAVVDPGTGDGADPVGVPGPAAVDEAGPGTGVVLAGVFAGGSTRFHWSVLSQVIDCVPSAFFVTVPVRSVMSGFIYVTVLPRSVPVVVVPSDNVYDTDALGTTLLLTVIAIVTRFPLASVHCH